MRDFLRDHQIQFMKHAYWAINNLELFGLQKKTYFDKKRTDALQQQSLDPALIDKMVQERTEARKSKEWEKADNIRNKLLEMNITIEDRTDGTIWKVGWTILY